VGGNEWGFQFPATFTCHTASCSSAASHQSYSTICRLLPVILLPNSNLQSPSSTVPCSGSPTCTRTTFDTTQDAEILGRSPSYLHTVPPLCHIFQTVWWRNHSCVLSYVSYCTFPHSGGGYQQLLQTLKNRAASMVHHIKQLQLNYI